MDLNAIFHYKYIFGVLSGFLLMVGSTIEPSIGIWVVSLGGSLLTVALGKDQTLKQVVINLLLGLTWGIFGSQILHGIQPIIPQIAAAFFLSMFGVNSTSYIIRNLQTNSFSDMVISIVDRIVPWKKKDRE